MALLEKAEERKFAKGLKDEYNLRAIKYTDSAKRGAPDRLVLLPYGKLMFIEFKRRGENLREEQIDYHKWLRSLDHYVVTCYTALGALARVREALQNDRKVFEDYVTGFVANRVRDGE